MKRVIPLTIASIVPFVAVFGGCSSSNKDAPAGGSSSPGLEAGLLSSDGAIAEAGPGEGGGDEVVAPANDTTAYAASLNGYQVVPPLQTGGQGTGQFTLLADGVTLQYDISASGLSSPVTSVNFHVGSAVDSAGISHQIVLGPDASTSGGSLSVTGSITLSGSTSVDEVDALPAGELYVDISTMNHQGGEIRGQIVTPGSIVMVANLTGAQEVPPVSSVYAAAAAFVVSPDGSTVRYHISPGANLTATIISGISNGMAIGGEPINQGVVNGLGSSTDGTIDISSSAPWLEGQEFVNITTQAHPSGEIRGQVILPGETLFTAPLGLTAAAQANGSVTQGGAEVILNAAQTGIRYEVDTTSGNLTGVFLNVGGFPGIPAGDAGTPDAGGAGSGGAVGHSYELTIMGMGATNEVASMDASTASLPLAAADVAQLLNGNGWILVDTNSYMSGEIQGALLKQ